jgi:regulatory protein
MESGQLTTKEAFIKAAGLCSKGEKCSPEIKRKIIEWGLDKYDAEAVVEELKQEKYIDDERYARAYVRDKFRFNKWGRTKMYYYMKQKGLPDDVIQAGFEEIEEEVYIELLLKIMSEKAKSIKGKSRFEKMGQIIRFAQNRGFEPELIHRHINLVVTE